MAARPAPSERQKRLSVYLAIYATILAGALLATASRIPLIVPADALNLNTADSERIALALEIDPTLADRIVRERERRGAFRSIGDAAEVTIVPSGRSRSEALAGLSRLDVNDADADRLATALRVPRPLAVRIVEARLAEPGRKFAAAANILDVPVLSPELLAQHRAQLIVRTPGHALAVVVLWLVCLGVVLIGTGRMLARSASDGDPWIVPVVWLIAGLAFIVWVGMGDALRENLLLGQRTAGLAGGAAALLVGEWSVTRQFRTVTRLRRRRSGIYVGLGLVGVWGAASMLTRGGASFGIPGLAWVGPFALMAALARLIYEAGSLQSGALDATSGHLGGRRHAAEAGLRRLDLWSPAAAAAWICVCTRDPGMAIVTGGAAALLIALVTGRRLMATIGWIGSLAVVPALAQLWKHGLAPFVEWWNPATRPAGAPLHLHEALWGLASGGFWGSGPGLGSPESIPRVSAVLFAAIAENLGVIGGVVALVSFVLVIWRFCRISVRAPNDGARLAGAAVASLIGAQTFVSVAGAIGLGPCLDVPMPFASDSRVLQGLWFAALGAMLAISRAGGRIPVGGDRRAFRSSMRALACGAAVALIAGCGLRLSWLQLFDADRVAGRQLRLLQSGEVVAIRENPRLVAIANAIERGSIYDAEKRVLATSRLREVSSCLPGDAGLARRYYRAGRYYPHGAACAPVLGLWLPRRGPVAGVEQDLDAHLRGYRRYSDLLPTYRGKDLPAMARRGGLRGGDVVLSINGSAQDEGYRILQAHASEDGKDGAGALVVLHALQGYPIVAVSLPSTDPNQAVLRQDASGIAANTMMLTVDRSAAPLYTPGALFKIAVALALPSEFLSTKLKCRHSVAGLTWRSGDREYTWGAIADDPLDRPHGAVGLARALRVSCNSYFAQLAVSVGAARLHGALKSVLGDGALPAPEDFARQLPLIATGDGGVLVSPMEVAGVLVAATAGSAPIRPVYWHQLVGADGRALAYAAPALGGKGRTSADLTQSSEVVRQALRDTVSEGPLSSVFGPLNVSVAGRTALVPTSPNSERRDAWFAGFAPYEKPAYVVACVVNGARSGFGTAAPAARDMLGVLLRP